jgi:hypothetical protein
VDADLARQVRENRLDYAEAVRKGLYKQLGMGDARVESVIEHLKKSRYRGWYAIDHDARLGSSEEKPLPTIKRSLDFVRRFVTA